MAQKGENPPISRLPPHYGDLVITALMLTSP